MVDQVWVICLEALRPASGASGQPGVISMASVQAASFSEHTQLPTAGGGGGG